MKVLVLGADGMLGHQLVNSWQDRHDVIGTVRLSRFAYIGVRQRLPINVEYGMDACNASCFEQLIGAEKPDAIVNGIGILKQRSDSNDIVRSIETNALLPHRLAVWSKNVGARLVHLSTNCVSSGAGGRYTEDDTADASDLYGRTKLMGEVGGANCVVRCF